MSEVGRGGGDRTKSDVDSAPFGFIPGYTGVMAKEHNFAPHAMEFLAPAGKSNLIELVE
jgi:hypothetical protein